MKDYKEVHKYIRLLMFRYCKRLCNTLEIPMLSEVNKVFKDNPIFVSLLLWIHGLFTEITSQPES